MGVITKISVQQKRIDRYNIEVDGSYAFSADEAVLIEFELKKGRVLAEADIEAITVRDGVYRGVNTAIQFLSLRMRSKKEVLDYLKKKEIEPGAWDEIMERLETMGYLNDEQFADAYIKTQIQTTEKGPKLILRELKEKGIDDHTASLLIEQFTEEDQVEKAAALFEKQLKKFKRDSAFLQQKKAEQYIMTKGYSADIVKKAANAAEPDKEAELEALMHQAERAHWRYRSFEEREYRQKMKAALYRKGFDLSDIDRVIDRLLEEQRGDE
ncbi:recombination regulator RecX [Domibacillus indicus]|uniref:recombination regulator RecX n=1 Tax=Domibacillus indicus TaxID=1437523 RepID=UPI00203C49E5|nr:recombination regulator RecX [Domibacillus indicus]MCM3789078.1 recombination regulator RecX [Domibacillus indicus]